MKRFLTTLMVALLLSITKADELFLPNEPSSGAAKKCYVLALSSGDENAAYQAGALKGIASSKFTPDEFAYDTVSGISGGALNAVILANYSKG